MLPLGSTEQHGYLSLGVDAILAERVSVEAAEPLGVPVLPALPFGLAPYFAEYPGSPSLRVETYIEVVRDLLDSLHGQGFRRFLLVNGHGGNNPAGAFAIESDGGATPTRRCCFHNWWNGPKTWPVVQSIDPDASPRLLARELPLDAARGRDDAAREEADGTTFARCAVRDPAGVRSSARRRLLRGPLRALRRRHARVWRAGVEEVRELLEDGWRDA